MTSSPDGPDLVEKCLPDYPPFGKRILLDDGWYAALRRDDVTLLNDSVAEITPPKWRTNGGEEHHADAVVLSTGFEQQRFLYPMQISGRNGTDLRTVWEDDDARAYLGITTPGFPNLFMTYGPNTNPGGGSTIFILECQVHYIVQILRLMLRRGIGTVECRREPHERYNARVDDAHRRMIWTHPGMDTYYRNARGRIVTNMPWCVVDYYWHMTRTVDIDDFATTPAVRMPSRPNLTSPTRPCGAEADPCPNTEPCHVERADPVAILTVRPAVLRVSPSPIPSRGSRRPCPVQRRSPRRRRDPDAEQGLPLRTDDPCRFARPRRWSGGPIRRDRPPGPVRERPGLGPCERHHPVRRRPLGGGKGYRRHEHHR